LSPYISDWLHLMVRWFHFTVGVAWIGASFYFNWLNNNVRPLEEDEEGVTGEVWAIHGGAYYRVTKHDRATMRLPKTLHWFKYEAYFTWISGALLLDIVYYLNSSGPLMKAGSGVGHWTGVGIGIGAMLGAWVVYDLLCKSPLAKNSVVFFCTAFAFFAAAAFGLSEVFSPRAAYIHVGAMVGTCMAANVFFVIIPGQRAMVEATKNGTEPDVAYGIAGSTRSLHNNYFTLPILFIMISSHFPMTYGSPVAWAVLGALALIGAAVRHWFNVKGRGEQNVWILPVAAVAMIGLMVVMKPAPIAPPPAGKATIPYSTVAPIVAARCTSCHSKTPTNAAFPVAPLGVMLDTEAQVRARLAIIKTQVVDTKVMPLGNLTKMTDPERALMGEWLAQELP
jgi:uncharacterized membrane protein